MKLYFWKKILDWYHENKREFPWRKTNNPYYIIIAEILLQQTNVRKVTPIYNELISRFSTPSLLAKADLEELESIIKPLGLLYRAKRLKQIAKIIVSRYNGNVPSTKTALKELPGIGDYVADAVLCYGFNNNTVPIDTNVIRLFSRYYNFKSDYSRARNDKKLFKKIRSMYDFENYKDPNLAVLDFASEICRAKNPRCNKCTLRHKCRYFIDKGDNNERRK